MHMTQHVLLCVLLMHLREFWDIIPECSLQSGLHVAMAGAA